MTRRCMILIFVLANIACDETDDPQIDDNEDTASTACESSSDSDLAGVEISFPEQPCRFTLAELEKGVEFKYVITVKDPIADITASPQDAGGCGQPGSSGLIVFEQIAGDDQRYCQCDVGLCAPTEHAVELSPGEYEGSFAWDGKNWTGPSDFGNPKGEPFPAGEYTVTVSAKGQIDSDSEQKPFEVKATLTIHVDE